MVKVLVVEDTPVVREYLVYILSSDPDIRVIGSAGNGEEALTFIEREKPDIITMDIHMPRMDGFEATRRIMGRIPIPIIIVSGSMNRSEVALTLEAMKAGALTFIPRPQGIGHPGHGAQARDFIQAVKLLSEVKVVRRWNDLLKKQPSAEELEKIRPSPKKINIIAIGASTGGPPVIRTLLEALPRRIRVPILIVQHIANGFVQGFVDWLSDFSAVPVRVASAGEIVGPGCAYVAPDDVQMGIGPEGRILLMNDEPEHGLRPSVSFLFRSVAQSLGPDAAGVLLTGMGKDGAEELLQIRKKGGVTFAQDKASSVIHGMPGEAIRLNAAEYVLPPDSIARYLASLASSE